MHHFLVGAGHVGLVTAVGMARLGHRVTVADIDASRIGRLQEGVPPIFEPGLAEGLRDHASQLTFTTELTVPADSAFSLVAVSTPTGPDGPLSMSHVEAAVGSILDQVGADHTIVVRSTLPMLGPDRLVALRSARAGSASIVTNPEFMREGSGLLDFEQPGRVIFGYLEPRDEPAARAALTLYAGIAAPVVVADARSVALIKLATNVFLATKIAYADELARLADAFGANVAVVADALGLDPRIGRSFLTAGPGFGGSCLPEQAVALAEIAAAAGIPTPLIASVAPSNRIHQASIVTELGALVAEDAGASPGGAGAALAGRRVAVLGLAFKANTDDVRESPALALVSLLRASGAEVVATDPRAIPRALLADPGLVTVSSPEEAAVGADAVLVVTEWADYRDLDWVRLAARMRGRVVYDTRAIVDRTAAEAAGLRLTSLGGR
jgi:UDPglucose 6-dehydrogenase